MRRRVIGLTILIMSFLFLTGCLNYMKGGNQSINGSTKNDSFLNDIAALEKELNVSKEDREIEEEVVLPDLEEEPEEYITEKNLQTIKVKENQAVSLKVRVDDPDQDKVEYAFSRPLNADGEWKTNYGDAGEYIVTISATDGELTTEKRVKLVVERVNVPPIIKTLDDLTVKEGETVSFNPEVSDPNKDPVSVTISEPLDSGTFATDHTSAGEYLITVTATDGELQEEESFTLKVTDVNVLPEIDGLEDRTVEEGETVEIKPRVTDLDGDKLTVTIGDPVGDDGRWETGYTDHGDYPILITVNDGKDLVEATITITVVDVNKPPTIVDVYAETK